jgi:membrane peptidoglycan carboxypeptidase
MHVAQLVGILEDVVNFGTGALAKLPDRAVAGKTGTADGSRDIWFVGFTTDYVTAVWCGNERNLEVGSRYATGGSTPAWVWKEYMSKYYELRPKPPRPFSFNVDYKLLAIDPLTGLLATEYTPNPVYKRFAPGTEPKESSPVPEVDEIGAREKPREITVGEASSNEDRRLRSAAEIKQKSEKTPKPMPKLDVQPKPKQFKILSTTDDTTEETINERQETQITPTAKPKIPEGGYPETRTNIGG